MVKMIQLAHRALGNTGLKTARLALGTVKLGRERGVKYPQRVKIPDDQQARALLDSARDAGINLIDTAPAYGSSEERLGGLLAEDRQHWIVCTKVGEEFDGDQSHYDFSPEHCRFSVERSLRRLRCETLNIVLIHSNGDDRYILEKLGTLDALKALQQEGKIGAIGISHKTHDGAMLAIEQGVDILMTTLNRDDMSEASLIEDAASQGVGILIKKALASGHNAPKDLQLVAQCAGVGSIVVGTTDIDHLHDNVKLISELESS